MFFHDATLKTRTTCKISNCFENLNFLNPRSYLNSFIVAFAISFFFLNDNIFVLPFHFLLFRWNFSILFLFSILLEGISSEVLLLFSDDVLISYEGNGFMQGWMKCTKLLSKLSTDFWGLMKCTKFVMNEMY